MTAPTMDGRTAPSQTQTEATEVASAYLEILNPDGAMTDAEVDAFNVGVQAGITAALEVSRRREPMDPFRFWCEAVSGVSA